MILKFPSTLWRHRELWWRLTEREVLGRYRGSLLGVAWSFLNPLAMLAVYTFIFSNVFQARWGSLKESGPLGFAINLFAGLICFNLMAECVNMAPRTILNYPNYVKKVIFPLEVLGAVTVGSAVFHALTSLVILCLFELIGLRRIPWESLWLPVVWLPLLLGCLGMSWLLGALGVFLRDLSQVVAVAVNMLMFLSPIFFPISALPSRWQPLLALNPLAGVIEQTRSVLVEGRMPDFGYVAISTVLTLVFCEASFRGFGKAKRGFADVL
jgi:lipopolysaccharide transport system permease protein